LSRRFFQIFIYKNVTKSSGNSTLDPLSKRSNANYVDEGEAKREQSQEDVHLWIFTNPKEEKSKMGWPKRYVGFFAPGNLPRFINAFPVGKQHLRDRLVIN
jgi:hypothetical protein